MCQISHTSRRQLGFGEGENAKPSVAPLQKLVLGSVGMHFPLSRMEIKQTCAHAGKKKKKDFFPPKIGKIPTVDGHSGAVAEVAAPQPLPPPPPRPKDPKRSQRLQKHKPLFLVISDECWSLEWRRNTSVDGPR